MDFNTTAYLLFLPLVCVGHWLLPQGLRPWLLLAASWGFYFCWNPGTGLLLVAVTWVSWRCAGGIARAASPRGKKGLLILTLAICLGTLAFFKYTGFFCRTLGLSLPFSILLPVGISFYTFQTLSYVIDVYRGTIAVEERFLWYALFVAFFPQLVAGPIERPRNLLPQLKARRQLTPAHLQTGLWLLLRGYFKKLLVADPLARLIDPIFQNPELALGPEVLAGCLLFGIQIYCDFSGYTDIARGSASLLGVELMENFREPYQACSVRDFWRRWHISLTQWFTDYVYIPLGGNRRGPVCQARNILIVFLLSGLWHGADWHFVIWGGLHGMYQIASLIWCRHHPQSKTKPWIARIRTFLLVGITWLFFRAATMADAWTLLSRIATGWSPDTLLRYPISQLLPGAAGLICLAVLPKKRPQGPQAVLTGLYLFTAIALAWLIALRGDGQNAFLYFQF